jgi:hypothetical protein
MLSRWTNRYLRQTKKPSCKRKASRKVYINAVPYYGRAFSRFGAINKAALPQGFGFACVKPALLLPIWFVSTLFLMGLACYYDIRGGGKRANVA